MSMDFETVRFMRILFGLVFLVVGAAGGYIYFGTLGAAGGALVGYVVGWNTVDLFKGRASK
jgi:hypothetical protein